MKDIEIGLQPILILMTIFVCVLVLGMATSFRLGMTFAEKDSENSVHYDYARKACVL